MSEISFPSDGLTIRAMRRAHRELFDVDFSPGAPSQPIFLLDAELGGNAGETVGGMLYWERELAVEAYARMARLPLPETHVDADTMRDELAALYVRYEIASDRDQAAVLIRDFEALSGRLAIKKGRDLSR